MHWREGKWERSRKKGNEREGGVTAHNFNSWRRHCPVLLETLALYS